MHFVHDYGFVCLLEGSNYNLILAPLVVYLIAEIYWNAIVRYSFWSLPYHLYEGENSVVHLVFNSRTLEPMYSRRVLFVHRWLRVRTKTAIHSQDPEFSVHTIPYL